MPPPRKQRPTDRDDDDFDDRPLRKRSNDADGGSNSRWIIIGVAAFLVVGGVIAFIATRGKTEKAGDPPTQVVDNKDKSNDPSKTGDQARKIDRSKDKTPKKKETIKKEPPDDLMVKIGKMVNGSPMEKSARWGPTPNKPLDRLSTLAALIPVSRCG